MTKLQIMNEIATYDPIFSPCFIRQHYVKRFRKNELLKVLDIFKNYDPDKIIFNDLVCYWLDDNFNRHFVVNRFIGGGE